MIRTIRTRAARLARVLAAAALALGIGVVAVPSFAQPAQAAGQVSISGEPDPNGQSTLQLQGSGFQSVQGGFGGIYVLFGWVDHPSGMSWSPSNGGTTGENYRYVYDDESNPAGFQLFVTFPGSSTAAAANGGEVAADGTWSAEIKVPGAVFNTFDRQLNQTQVDCTEVTCGIITIGAHGVKNANNESFTPVNWAGTAGGGTGATGTDDSASADTEAPAAESADTGAEAPAADTSQQQVAAPAEGAASTADTVVPGWWPVLLPALILVGISLLVLAGGVGGYLAMKSLLLGVNPDALEKVRGQRERAAIKERDRQQRKTRRLERKMELRGARDAERGAALVARMEMKHGVRHADAPQPAAPSSAEGAGQTVDQWLSFFQKPAGNASQADADASRGRHGAEDTSTLVMSTQGRDGEAK
jgi:hypothetical protein